MAWERVDQLRAILIAGAVSITVGGLVSAVTRPLDWAMGSWVAAYLVLVGGVAQIGLGAGQAWIAADPPDRRTLRAQVALWNLSVLATIAGTLLSVPLLTTVGGISTVVALASFLVTTRHVGPGSRWPVWAFRVILWIVLLSTPIGVVLSWIRHG